MWEEPTEEDLTTCAGCGKPDTECNGDECLAYAELIWKAYEDEKKGIFLPSYCAETKQKFCTKCGVRWDEESSVCNTCKAPIV